jgi:hypothetical protein
MAAWAASQSFTYSCIPLSPSKKIQQSRELPLTQAARRKPSGGVFQFTGHFCANLFGLHFLGVEKC